MVVSSPPNILEFIQPQASSALIKSTVQWSLVRAAICHPILLSLDARLISLLTQLFLPEIVGQLHYYGL